ncbi:UDP-glucuronic acid decarboxylase family protein [Streptomyces sp. VRA16 Mangrove soil]|uniref:UDP-glucuronic acid decarboxylase family protein n=1 Tax=Streptomyces sp. VRA16 Mangrove soil TaxID=2817434 RepID=UPI001A9E34BC|nr:UDP-glucuronic acid decarboxylase family protein [Streptomyces sp. VRA16 Mangrove soil]MBO1332906.1 SDR family oxidoreductase [Streptomyces sp. VRA16 Mangrove soil]
MRVVVTGGGGFLGSHLCEALLYRGDTVWCLDNFCTGTPANVTHLLCEPRFRLVSCDVTEPFRVPGPVHAVAHLASPASPPDYERLPLETLAAGSQGTRNALRLALAHDARFLLASTSEAYGDPEVHPQPESYWGHVNPVGPRSVYDEAKRYAEALTMAHRRSLGANTGIVRIFNTYGPRMRPYDGRVVSTFLRQALAGLPLTIFGDGLQTRSFCYVDDLVRGLVAMLDAEAEGPVNLGNPGEFTVRELADLVLRVTGSASVVEYRPLPVDDPTRRRPAVDLARSLLGWDASVPLEEGLRRTAVWSRAHAGTRQVRTREPVPVRV